MQPALPDANDVASRPTLVLLHFLGGSSRSWDQVQFHLASRFPTFAVDLPGFGDAMDQTGYDVAAMADHVAAIVRRAAPGRWALVGHSMGAKVAAVLARRAEDGAPGLEGLSTLVLLAGSPPAPEPMDEERRTKMKGWFAGGLDTSRGEARFFIEQNVGTPFDDAVKSRAVDDVLRVNRAAWLAWLDGGSIEDWAERIGVLQTPTLIVAGGRDADLGEKAQRTLMARHFANSSVVTLDGAGHLLPMERANEIAELIEGAVTNDPPPFSLIDSDRVSARTRALLRDRAADASHNPKALAKRDIETLRALLVRVIPQQGDHPIDLAARIDTALASETGDGWRFAALPPDIVAYRMALRTLDAGARGSHGEHFAALGVDRQDDLLDRMAEGKLSASVEDGACLSASQMKLWFEDLRGDATRIYVSHPRTQARIGFDGFANGGDGPRKQGFVRVGAGEREPWEPVAQSEVVR